MKKLSDLFPRTDIKINAMSDFHCELTWNNRGKSYLVMITNDGHLSVSTNQSVNNRFTLSKAEIKEFINIFLDTNDVFSTSSSSNATHIKLNKKSFTPDDSFHTLYRFLKAQNALSSSMIKSFM